MDHSLAVRPVLRSSGSRLGLHEPGHTHTRAHRNLSPADSAVRVTSQAVRSGLDRAREECIATHRSAIAPTRRPGADSMGYGGHSLQPGIGRLPGSPVSTLARHSPHRRCEAVLARGVSGNHCPGSARALGVIASRNAYGTYDRIAVRDAFAE